MGSWADGMGFIFTFVQSRSVGFFFLVGWTYKKMIVFSFTLYHESQKPTPS